MDAPSDIAKALQSNPVYVGTGLPAGEASDISSVLSSSDGIKVVALDKGAPVNVVAQQVLAEQPQGTVLIVASGDEVTAVANAMPEGDLSNLLARSENVSTNGLDTIRTLVTNVHSWQVEHPQTVTATAQPEGFPVVPILGGGVPLLIVVVGLVAILRRRSRRLSPSVSGNSPRDVRPLVAALMHERSEIRNPSMRASIEGLCENVEAYYKRVKNIDGAASVMPAQLHDALDVVKVFRDCERFPRYYRTPGQIKTDGYRAVDGLSQSILESIRSNNARALVQYTVSTSILQAQRYK